MRPLLFVAGIILLLSGCNLIDQGMGGVVHMLAGFTAASIAIFWEG